MFPYVICTQVVLCTSISTACMAYIWPFLKSLQSGLFWADHTVPNTANPTVNSSKSPSNLGQSASRRREEDRRAYVEIAMQVSVRKDNIGEGKIIGEERDD